MFATNIKWDTDGDKELLKTLPSEVEIPEGMTGEEEISDYLSEVTGFCHEGYALKKHRYDWKEGENQYQKYYDVTVDGKYLLVFANKGQPDIWMAMIDGIMIHDRIANDKQRQKQGLPSGCPLSQLYSTTLLTSKDPDYMMEKAEWCFENHAEEALGENNQSYCVSLKTLYDNGVKSLRYGGKILHTEEDGADFYDLRRDDSDLILLCDGEKLTDCKWCKDEDGNSYLVGTAEDSEAQIYLSKEEFDLAVFQYQKTDIEKLMDEIRKLKSSEKKDIKFDMDARNEIHVELAVYMNGEKKTIIEWRDKITGLVHEAATCDTSDDSDVRSALEYIRRCCLDSIE